MLIAVNKRAICCIRERGTVHARQNAGHGRKEHGDRNGSGLGTDEWNDRMAIIIIMIIYQANVIFKIIQIMQFDEFCGNEQISQVDLLGSHSDRFDMNE